MEEDAIRYGFEIVAEAIAALNADLCDRAIELRKAIIEVAGELTRLDETIHDTSPRRRMQ